MTDDWKLRRLEEVAAVTGGGTPSTTDPENFGGDIPWVTPKDLSSHTGKYIASGERSISQKGLANSSAKLMPAGTVLVSSRAPIGLTAIAEVELATNQGCRSLTPDASEVDTEFLYYLMSASTDYLHQHANGTTFQEVSGGVMKKLEFLFPPLAEQVRIAEVLSALDDAIATTVALEHHLMDRALAHLELALDTGPTKSILVQEAATFLNKRRIPLSQMERDKRPGPYPYHGATGVFGFVDDYLFDGLHLLVGEDGSVIEDDGSPVLQLAYGKFWVNNHAHVLTGKGIPTASLWFALRTLQVDPAVTGAVQPKLSMGRLGALSLVYPQDSSGFEAVAEETITQLLTQRDKRRSLNQMKDFLLPRLLSGELRVQEAEVLAEASA